MKSVSILFSTVLFCISAQAGPRFFNATFESKTLGTFQASLKVSELSLPIEAVPQTQANITRDNGQIVLMDCVTTARFQDVGQMNVKISNPQQILSTKTLPVEVLISNSYQMNDEEELCNTSSLQEIQKGHVATFQVHAEIPIQLNGETFYLSVSAIPFSSQIDVLVSGDENRMSLDWVDLFTTSNFQKPSLNYSVYKKSAGSVSFLEHGSVFLNLQ